MFTLEPFMNTVKEKNLNLDAVMVIQNGTMLGLHRFSDMVIHNVFSVAKSYTATAIGIAVGEGKLKLDDKPAEMFAELMPAEAAPGWKDVTLYHLLTMNSGHGKAHLMASDRKKLRGESEETFPAEMMEEWLLFAFTRPMVCEPGKNFRYGNLAPYVAGRMLEQAVGMSVCDYLYERLWQHIGVKKPRWDTDPAGHTFGASDLYLDIVDMAKLGQLYLSGGVYEGVRYLSEDWVKMATAKHTNSTWINPIGSTADETAGYGFYFWRNQEEISGFRCYGREGQFVIVLPEKNAVIATQAMHSDVQQILDAVWDKILPQLG